MDKDLCEDELPVMVRIRPKTGHCPAVIDQDASMKFGMVGDQLSGVEPRYDRAVCDLAFGMV